MHRFENNFSPLLYHRNLKIKMIACLVCENMDFFQTQTRFHVTYLAPLLGHITTTNKLTTN